MRAIRMVGIALSAVVIASVIAWTPEKPTKSGIMRRDAAQWIKSHKAALPTTFEPYVVYPYVYRRLMYAELSWPDREALWRQQVETFLAPASTLSLAQRHMVQSVQPPLTDQDRDALRQWLTRVVDVAYKPGLSDKQREAIARPMCQLVNKQLGRDRTRAILGQLGPVDSAYIKLIRSEAASRVNQAAVPFAIPEVAVKKALARIGLYRPPGNCFCNVSSGCDCGGGQYCVNSSCSLWYGCGCGSLFECNGIECAQG